LGDFVVVVVVVAVALFFVLFLFTSRLCGLAGYGLVIIVTVINL